MFLLFQGGIFRFPTVRKELVAVTIRLKIGVEIPRKIWNLPIMESGKTYLKIPLIILLMERNPKQPPFGCIKPCKSWEKLPYQLVNAGYLPFKLLTSAWKGSYSELIRLCWMLSMICLAWLVQVHPGRWTAGTWDFSPNWKGTSSEPNHDVQVRFANLPGCTVSMFPFPHRVEIVCVFFQQFGCRP